VALSGTERHSVPLSAAQCRSVALSAAQCRSVALSAAQCRSVALSARAAPSVRIARRFCRVVPLKPMVPKAPSDHCLLSLTSPVERFEFQARNGKVYGILRKRCPNTVKTKLFQGGRKSLGKAGEPHAVRRSLSGHSCQTRRQKPMVCATFSIVFLDFGALNGAAPECPSWALSGTERH